MRNPIWLIVLAAGPAAADIDVYGRLNVTLQDSDEARGEKVELQSNASRIGVKGEERLNGGLKAIYQLEWEIDPDADDGDDVFSPRNQYVGIAGAFGTIKVGRHDTALKRSQGAFDQFNDLEGDIKHTFTAENRLKNYIGYATPVLAKAFTVTLNVFPGEDAEGGDDGIADAASVSVQYKTDAVYAAVARDRDIDGEGVDSTRLTGGYTFGRVQIMLLYQHTDAGAVHGDGFGTSVACTFGKYKAKLQYLDADLWRTAPADDPLDNRFDRQLSLGLDRTLGKRTKVFGFYTRGEIGGTSEREQYVGIGLRHDF